MSSYHGAGGSNVQVRSNRGARDAAAPLSGSEEKAEDGGRSTSLDFDYHAFLDGVAAPGPTSADPGADWETKDFGPVEMVGLINRLRRAVGGGMTLTAPADGERPDWENPNIPAGYVYLLQLVGHDLVATSDPTPAILFGGPPVANLRQRPLQLETLFGGGPSVCPIAYRPVEGTYVEQPRLHLRTGPLKPTASRIDAVGCDLARAVEQREGALCRDVMIADVRNDDNAILAQLTSLFCRIHNGVVDRLERLDGPPPPGGAPRRSAMAQAICAHLYRRVLREDLFARLLHRDVYDAYATSFDERGDAGLLDQPADPRSIPREFALALSRIGHFMVRPHYPLGVVKQVELRNIVNASSRRVWDGLPQPATWGIDWSRFFPGRDAEANAEATLSVRIGLNSKDPFSSGSDFPISAGSETPVRAQPPGGLLAQDLARGADARLRSAFAVTAAIGVAMDAGSVDCRIKALKGKLPSDARIRTILTSHLAPARSNSDFQLPNCDFCKLLETAPLLVFAAAEAAEDQKGERLGLVGSILVAEVMFRAMARRRDAQTELQTAWDQEVAKKSRELLNVARLQMADLVALANGTEDDTL